VVSRLALATLFNGAELSGADLHSANLTRVDLSGADLRRAKGLTQAQIDSAYTDGRMKLPVDSSFTIETLPAPSKARR